MKQYFIFFMCLLFAANISAQSLQGEGTAASPYLVKTAADLNDLRNYVGDAYKGKHFRMTNNIDVADWIATNADNDIKTNGWKPIGSNASAQRFFGHFHGGGFAVTGIWMNRTTTYCGLFAYLEFGMVDNLGIKVPAGKELKGANYTGGIAGYQTDGSITNCFFSGTVAGGSYTAGMVGYGQRDTISFCYAEGVVAGGMYSGGMAGYTAGATGDATVISNCINAATIAATSTSYVGSIVGYNQMNAETRKCVAVNSAIAGASRIGGKSAVANSVFENNHALASMLVNGVARTSDNASGNDGQDHTLAALQASTFYTDLGWTFGAAWTIREGRSFPYVSAISSAPAITTTRISTVTTELTGTFVPETGSKVWVKIGSGEAKEATANTDGTWSAAISGQKATEMVYVWTTANGKVESLPISMLVEFANAGTPEDPFQVFSAADLQTMNIFRDKSYKLMVDIDITEWINEYGAGPDDFGWKPIGSSDATTFKGTFDGNHKTITGLWCEWRWAKTGLFGTVAGATIKNLTVKVAEGKILTGGSNRETGIIAGIFNGNMSNCAAYGAVQSPQEGTAGIVGILTGGEIKDSYAYVENLFNGNGQGGFVGKVQNDGKITNCYVAGILSGHQFVGGIVGYMQTGSATLSGNVSALTSIKGTIGTPLRIADNNWGGNVLQNNLAWSGMTVNGSVVTSADAASTNGKDATMDELCRQATYEAIGWTFDNDHWAIWDGYSLPYFPHQAAPAVLNGTPVAGVTSLSGNYKQGDAEKVWVQIDALPAKEATLNNGAWTLAVDALPAGTKISLWATSASKAVSNTNSYHVGYAQGSGTADDPYLIGTADEMNAVRYFLSAHYRLKNDIDLTVWADNQNSDDIRANGWLPVGTEAVPFTGTFDGKGYTLKVKLNRVTTGKGLFGYIDGATVRRINVGADITGGGNTGGIAGKALNSVIDSCYVSGTVISPTSGGIGGIVGWTENTAITWSSSEGKVMSTYEYGDNVGGIAGYSSGCNISYCYSLADVKGYGSTGGLVGYNGNTAIANCYASGIVTGADGVGGITGYNSSDIGNTVASGIISGRGSDYNGIGGISGTLVPAQWGNPAATVSNSVAAVKSLNGQTNINRIAGKYNNNFGTITNALALKDMSVQDKTRTSADAASADGKDAESAVLFAKSTYPDADGWDWDAWTIWEGSSLPYFTGQAAPPAWNGNISVASTQITGTFNSAETQKVWVKINSKPVIEAALSGNNWNAELSGLAPDDTLSVWGTHADKRRSFAVWAFVKAEPLEGDGTEASPYLIKNANDLYAMRYAAPKSHYRIENDIDLTAFLTDKGAGWLPAGSASEPFKGTINGDGHTIKGLRIKRGQQSIGMFAYARDTKISNLNMSLGDASIEGGYEFAGVLIGKAAKVELSDCHVSGNINANTMYTGGFIGQVDTCKINDCSFVGSIRNTATAVGGIIASGNRAAEIRRCYVAGDTLKANYYAGGIAYSLSGAGCVIADCYSDITVTANNQAGGIVSSIYRIYPAIEAAEISNNYARGNVTALSTSSQAAGIAQENQYGKVTGNVAASQTVKGGTVARITSSISEGRSNNNFALADMKFAATTVVAADTLNGEPRTRTQLLTQAPYEELGWDFTDTWAICESGVGFPYLQWQSALCLPDDTLKLAYGGQSATVHPSAVNIPDGITPEYRYKIISSGKYASVSGNGTVNPLAAGIDTLRVTLISSGYSVDCIIDVSAIAITVTADNLTKVYGETDPSLTWKITKGSLKEGDALTGALTRSDGGPLVAENAGTHDILRGTLGNPNYNITFVKGALAITPRPVTLTADNKEKTYGETDPVFTYQKTDGSFGFEDMLDDIVYGTLERESGENGGTYAIRQGSLTFISNYDVTFVEGVFTINRANQTVTLEAVDRRCADSDDEIVLKGAATSGLPLRFESSNPNVAIVTADDGWVHINGAGATKFTAYQDGNENFNPAVSSGERTFIVDLPSSTVKSKWNNEVLIVDNKDGKFAAYQWYRNGKMVDGASEQAYTINGFVADYTVTIVTTDGETLKTCPYKPTLTIAKASEGKAWPNPVSTSQQLTVELPLTDEEANGATVRVYDSNGRLVSTSKAEQSRWLMNSPARAGLYHIRVVTTKGETVNVKIVVE